MIHKAKWISLCILFVMTFSIGNMTLVTSGQQLYTGHQYTGTIGENGDQYWDDNELKFYSVKIFAGETIKLDMFSGGELEVMICHDCSDEQDIENILSDILYGTIPPNLHLWIDSYYSTSGEFTATSTRIYKIAVFSYSSSNPSSSSYSLTSNLRLTSYRYSYSGSISGNSDGTFSSDDLVGFLFEMRSNEILDINIISLASVNFIICSCNATEAASAINTGSGIYTAGATPTFNFQASSRTDYNIYFYSTGSSVNFNMYTNMEEGEDRITSSSGFNSTNEGNPLIGLIFIGVIIAVIWSWAKNKDKSHSKSKPMASNTKDYTSWNQTQQSYSTNTYQQQQETNIGNTALFCSNCGEKATTKFCTNCGTMVQD